MLQESEARDVAGMMKVAHKLQLLVCLGSAVFGLFGVPKGHPR